MKTQFAPGPWELCWEDGKHGVIAQSVAGKLVCIVANNDPTDGNEEIRKANARLIAAAPAMFEALEACRKAIYQLHKDAGGCDHAAGVCCCSLLSALGGAQEALAAARGEA